MRYVLWILLIVPAGLGAQEPRRVFVVHSGLHTILSDPGPNTAAERIRDLLLERGIGKNDVVVLDNPFPVASWKRMFPRDSFRMFLESMLPQSNASQDAYLRLHQVLQQRQVGADDALVWVGHSAGGQIGMTLSHLAKALPAYPELAKRTRTYRFDMVVTLGSPVGSNLVPAEVKLRHYFSPADRVVRLASVYGSFALLLAGENAVLQEVPPGLKANGLVRIFQGIEHPDWDDGRVVDRILREYQKQVRPAWRSVDLGLHMGQGLSNLLSQVLEEHHRLTLEDPP